jgi:flagellar biosynthetic protein FlhB
MADKNQSGEPTEPPSEKKLRDARKRGEVPKSREVVSAAIFLGTASLIAFVWPTLVNQVRLYLGGALEMATARGATPQAALAWGQQQLLLISLPIVATAAGLALVASFAQVGALLTLHPVKPSLGKLNPISNAKQMFGKKSLLELLKSVIKVGGMGYLAALTLWQYAPQLLGCVGKPPEKALLVVGACLWTLTIRIGVLAIAMAVLDLLQQRFSHTKKMRMTKEEVKRESKESEGDPQHKSERQRLHREVLDHQSLESVAKADCVIVNPTKLAVALRYDAEQMDAPRVVARGRHQLAAQIRRIARQHGVPIVRNVPLASALVDLELDEEIPAELYEAVAEVLRFVYEVR